MHALLIHQAFVSPNDAGGTRHYELARHWASNGNHFTIVASNISYLTGKSLRDREVPVVETYDDVRVLRAYTYPSFHRSFAWRVISFLSFTCTSVVVALHAGSCDVVMGTSPPIFQAVSAWLVAKLRRRPFLLEVRDLWPAFAVDIGVLKNPLLIWLAQWLERFLYAQATHIIVNSPAYRDYLVQHGVPVAKVTLIANGVDPTMFDPSLRGEAMRQSLGLADKFFVTYSGALGMANDIPTILHCANLLRAEPQIHFLIVGDGKERARIEALARDLDLPNITFLGVRPKSEMPTILAASDACVATLRDIPMFRTTYPNKVFDYMAAGRPTILAIDGVIREVIERAEGGVFVRPGDAAALAAAVQRLAYAPATCRAMGLAARAYVELHFNRHQQAEQFVALVHALATEG